MNNRLLHAFIVSAMLLITTPAYSLRRSTVCAATGLTSLITAALIHEHILPLHVNFPQQKTSAGILFSAACSGVVNGLLYAVFGGYTADSYLRQATQKLDQISYKNVMMHQLFMSEESVLRVLKHYYPKDDAWLITAEQHLVVARDNIIDTIRLVAKVKKQAKGDWYFIHKCDYQLNRARFMLKNVSQALEVIDQAIMNDCWEIA